MQVVGLAGGEDVPDALLDGLPALPGRNSEGRLPRICSSVRPASRCMPLLVRSVRSSLSKIAMGRMAWSKASSTTLSTAPQWRRSIGETTMSRCGRPRPSSDG